MIRKILIFLGLIKKQTKVSVPVGTRPTVPPSAEPTTKDIGLFPDISRYRLCDFLNVNFEHLIFKATEGVSLVDTTLYKNIEGCKNKNIKCGVYHFYRVRKSPIEQAKFFIEKVGLDNLKNMYHLPIVDYETVSHGSALNRQDADDLGGALDELKEFIKYVNKETGRKMRIYTGEYLLNKLKFDAEFLEICELPWVANYNKAPVKFGPWNSMWAWQYTDAENFSGIDKPCDGNKFV